MGKKFRINYKKLTRKMQSQIKSNSNYSEKKSKNENNNLSPKKIKNKKSIKYNKNWIFINWWIACELNFYEKEGIQLRF